MRTFAIQAPMRTRRAHRDPSPTETAQSCRGRSPLSHNRLSPDCQDCRQDPEHLRDRRWVWVRWSIREEFRPPDCSCWNISADWRSRSLCLLPSGNQEYQSAKQDLWQCHRVHNAPLRQNRVSQTRQGRNIRSVRPRCGKRLPQALCRRIRSRYETRCWNQASCRAVWPLRPHECLCRSRQERQRHGCRSLPLVELSSIRSTDHMFRHSVRHRALSELGSPCRKTT